MTETGDIPKVTLDETGDISKVTLDETVDISKVTLDETGAIPKVILDETGDISKVILDETGAIPKAAMAETGAIPNIGLGNITDIESREMNIKAKFYVGENPELDTIDTQIDVYIHNDKINDKEKTEVIQIGKASSSERLEDITVQVGDRERTGDISKWKAGSKEKIGDNPIGIACEGEKIGDNPKWKAHNREKITAIPIGKTSHGEKVADILTMKSNDRVIIRDIAKCNANDIAGSGDIPLLEVIGGNETGTTGNIENIGDLSKVKINDTRLIKDIKEMKISDTNKMKYITDETNKKDSNDNNLFIKNKIDCDSKETHFSVENSNYAVHVGINTMETDQNENKFTEEDTNKNLNLQMNIDEKINEIRNASHIGDKCSNLSTNADDTTHPSKVECKNLKVESDVKEVTRLDTSLKTDDIEYNWEINVKDDMTVKSASEVDIDIKVTIALTDSSPEDEEVKNIMESCDELDKREKDRSKKIKRLKRPRKYEEIKLGRKRSKSIDNGALQSVQNCDFSKYGISIGSEIPTDLLPGIEDYLCNVLANETLSVYAEEQRQYFLERLDIIKLPPSIPPRPQSLGVRLYPVQSSPPSSNRDSVPSFEQDDFAAYQRELSRALLAGSESSPNTTEVKVYDDIDITDGSLADIKPSKRDDEDSMYEIPQLQRTLCDSGYEKALELSPLSRSTSSEEQLSGQSGTTLPPPLPPRGERSSIGSLLEDQIPDTSVYKGKLHRELSAPMCFEKTPDSRSEKSNSDLRSDEDYDGMSGDSLDDVATLTPSQAPTLRIKLPRPVKRKHISHHRKLGKSLSSLWEITQPFSMLEDVVMSGELHYRSKLTWTRKIVALTNGRLVCYKVDKTDSRPAFVVMLTGYVATIHKREARRSFEIHLTHDNFESYVFLVDFKEWADIWCEQINAASKGQRASGPVVHLARSSMIANHDGTYHMAKTNLQLSNSNVSLTSSDGFELDPGTVKVKKRYQSGTTTARMGSFAFKATQFFESLGKKASVKKTSSTSSDHTPSAKRMRPSFGSMSSLSDMPDKFSPRTPDSNLAESPVELPLEVEKHIKHQGYLDIYSSFNKRKWGKRWCLVHENNFECYRTRTSEVCELEFLLRNCILRRAIEETKSELGLMLLENNREKITIEPINWTELGSWLRILMQETSTRVTPEGLEGYMDDSHPYHEAMEITRVPDPVHRQSRTSIKSMGIAIDDEKIVCHRNRDSGICSSESTDDRFSSLDQNLNSPSTHPCFNDSSLPRVSVTDTGAIYTRVKKSIVTGSKTLSASGSGNTCNQSKSSRTSNRSETKRNDNRGEDNRDTDDDNLFFDFEIEPFHGPSYKREGSLVDEIMSELKIKHSHNTRGVESDIKDVSDSYYSPRNMCGIIQRRSPEFMTLENELSPIKPEDVTMTGDNSDFLCSSFVETAEKLNSDANADVSSDKIMALDLERLAAERPVSVRRHPSNVSVKVVVDANECLAELRTRLVQLKKDRISIRDRKQQISSQTDREFLEAEYERLNRECTKVSDEIKNLEQASGCVGASAKHNSNQLEMIPDRGGTCDESKSTEGNILDNSSEPPPTDNLAGSRDKVNIGGPNTEFQIVTSDLDNIVQSAEHNHLDESWNVDKNDENGNHKEAPIDDNVTGCSCERYPMDDLTENQDKVNSQESNSENLFVISNTNGIGDSTEHSKLGESSNVDKNYENARLRATSENILKDTEANEVNLIQVAHIDNNSGDLETDRMSQEISLTDVDHADMQGCGLLKEGNNVQNPPNSLEKSDVDECDIDNLVDIQDKPEAEVICDIQSVPRPDVPQGNVNEVVDLDKHNEKPNDLETNTTSDDKKDV